MEFDKGNFSEWFSKVLELQDIIDLRYPVKGMPVYKGWGFKLLRNSFEILERLLDESGHQRMLFPLLIPEDQFDKEAEHIKGFKDEVLWATHGGLKKLERNLALRPTSETAVYPMFALWVRSHNDLPLKVHQTTCVYRHETKATKPLVRGREVYWNEAHTANRDFEDADRQVEEGFEIYSRFWDELCIPFLALRRPEHDKFPGAVYTVAMDTLMPDGKVLQIATLHNLGENFSRVYGIVYTDEKGERRYACDTCYGISMRCLAALISIHGDDRGLVLPPAVAPVQVIIVPIPGGEKEKIIAKCNELKERLKQRRIRAEVDAGNKRPGEKYYFWEGRGVPVRLELGPKDFANGQVVLAKRTGGKTAVAEGNVIEEVERALGEIEKELRERAWAELRKNMREADTLEKVRQLIEKHGGFIETGWCGRRECADTLKANTTAEIRGTLYRGYRHLKKKCLVCGLEAKETVWIAKAY